MRFVNKSLIWSKLIRSINFSHVYFLPQHSKWVVLSVHFGPIDAWFGFWHFVAVCICWWNSTENRNKREATRSKQQKQVNKNGWNAQMIPSMPEILNSQRGGVPTNMLQLQQNKNDESWIWCMGTSISRVQKSHIHTEAHKQKLI